MEIKKSPKVLVQIVALLIIGGIIGFAVGNRIGFKAGGFTTSTMEYSLSHHQLEVAFSEADCQGVRDALMMYLAIVEKHKNNPNSAFSGRVAYADTTLTHARLARVARKLGDNDLTRQHLQAATESCERARWEDCSEVHILAVSKRLEQGKPIACLASEYLNGRCRTSGCTKDRSYLAACEPQVRNN